MVHVYNIPLHTIMKFSFCKREKIEAFALLKLVLRKLEKNVIQKLP
jgi:hypothetical protein